MKFCPECDNRLRPRNGVFFCTRCDYQEQDGVISKSGSSLSDFFPFPSMRPFQKETLDKIEDALKSTKFVILEAPVGFGKSAVAVALSRNQESAHILTSTKQLQDQYSNDFRFPVVKGKSNFRCEIPKNVEQVVLDSYGSSSNLRSYREFPLASKGKCVIDWNLKDCPHYTTFEEYKTHKSKQCNKNSKCEKLKDNKLCIYYNQKWSGFRAPITVYNYPFLLSEIKYAADVPHRKLLVCDEVHDLEKQILGFSSFSIKNNVLKKFHDQIRPEDEFIIPNKGEDEPTAWIDVLYDIEDILKEFSTLPAYKEIDQDQTAISKEMLKDLESFVDDLKRDPSNWVINNSKKLSNNSIEEITFQPIHVGDYTFPLFNVADSILLMSATVFSKERLCTELGISINEASFIQISESTFPVEHRPIFAMNTAKLNRETMNAALPKITQMIDRIMHHHKYDRGIVHTTSYNQTNYILQKIPEPNKKRLKTTEGNSNRTELMKKHDSSDASVLISPSLHQGIDLKDESSRFQIIMKVPYPDLSQKRTKIKLQRDREWYDWQTALRLVQTYGRSVRSEDDYATTYILDTNFTQFVQKNRNLFPTFFLEALRNNSQALPSITDY